MTVEQAPPVVPRLRELDALRGFALGGVLLVNIEIMSDPSGFAPGAARTLSEALFHNKFYVLFSFLFGYSLTMQLRSAERAGVSGRGRTVRRCLALMAIGVVHAVFFFTGDVLFGYGAIGLVLLVIGRRLRPRAALWVAAALYGIGTLVIAVMTAAGREDVVSLAERDRLLDIARAGWRTAAAWRWELFAGRLPTFLLFGLFNVLPLFLVGLAAGTARLLESPERYLPWLPRVQWVGFGAGLPISASNAITQWPPLAGPAMIAGPLVAAAYGATLLRISHNHPRVAEFFAPAGRIAATVYIGQSLITSLIFTGYGLALAGRMTDWTVLAIAVVLYTAQLALASRWTRRHRYGPIEYLLRAITYGPGHLRPSPRTVDS
ncbi:DUF418 domain-containing protein [Nocardia sp. NPDC004151]|uniref:DUF418 domain-containing protein n=1 Tax=Nocardia sp. NPDC004151 TaxID=3364304 RepID=UPI0036A0633D